MMAANPAGADVCPADNELGLRWLRAFPGTKAQVAEVRRFVTCLLAEHPACEALITCVSELAANAVVHTASGCGGFFTVEVSCPRSGVARVSVTDAGGPTEPAAGAPVAVEPGDEDIDGLLGLLRHRLRPHRMGRGQLAGRAAGQPGRDGGGAA
jgi:anti-sigma regulatory factor (Ser/Thr protein kinase)